MPVIAKEILVGTKKVRRLNLEGNVLNEIRKGWLMSCNVNLSYDHYLLSCVSDIIARMTSLEFLDLSHNQLTHLTDGLIGPLPNLTELDLSYNLLVSLPIEDISESWNLTRVDLRGNRLTRFYDEFMALIQSKNGTDVLMEGNPIECDCRLRPLQFWLNARRDVGPWGNVLCSGPPTLSGQPLSTVSDESLSCSRDDDFSIKPKYNIVTDIVFRDVSAYVHLT